MNNYSNGSEKESLRDRIKSEMVSDYEDTLERHFDLAKKLIKIQEDGKVFLKSKDSLTGKYQVALYLIGKVYSEHAGYSDTRRVGNKELQNQLGAKSASVRGWTKALRDENKIKTVKESGKSFHRIKINYIESILSEVLESIDNKNTEGDA